MSQLAGGPSIDQWRLYDPVFSSLPSVQESKRISIHGSISKNASRNIS
ncbi:hypothetical protein GGD65_005386 [Bradyrhizobium sp. CIR18]|nr:hypothetical protein [Bradyrhizobium sp. CIR18]MBB4364328.1 hypothetical protein [Bradyrhizobium sp. CIR18]